MESNTANIEIKSMALLFVRQPNGSLIFVKQYLEVLSLELFVRHALANHVHHIVHLALLHVHL